MEQSIIGEGVATFDVWVDPRGAALALADERQPKDDEWVRVRRSCREPSGEGVRRLATDRVGPARAVALGGAGVASHLTVIRPS